MLVHYINHFMKTIKARKQYKCDITNNIINPGDNYKRVNIRYHGIYHFVSECTDSEIYEFLTETICTQSCDYDYYDYDYHN